MAKFLSFISEAVTKDKTHVMTFMRANPPTIGHERVINQVKQLATDLGGDHTVVLSHTHDGQKNPLTAEQKLRHAKRAFPNTNIKTSSPEEPNILNIASGLHKKGVNDLHVVVGQDRLKQFDDLLHKYNGHEGPHGYFDFKNIKLHSAGDRDPDAEGVEGVSGTSQRKHALTGNRENFHLGAPSAMAPEHKDEMMHDIINGTVLTSPKKPKKLKENTTTADARGLGYVTGDPAVDGVVTTNDVDSLFFRGGLKQSIKQSENPLAGVIGFKSFDPDKVNTRDKTLSYYHSDPNAELLLRDKLKNKGKDNNATRG